MAFCRSCGRRIGEQLTVCLGCSRRIDRDFGAASLSPSASGERVAAAFSYSLFWVTGLVLFLTDKRPFVRYHAAQSVLVFGVLQGLAVLLRSFLGVRLVPADWTEISLAWVFLVTSALLGSGFWVLCIWQASRGKWFKVPGAAGIAAGLATQP